MQKRFKRNYFDFGSSMHFRELCPVWKEVRTKLFDFDCNSRLEAWSSCRKSPTCLAYPDYDFANQIQTLPSFHCGRRFNKALGLLRLLYYCPVASHLVVICANNMQQWAATLQAAQLQILTGVSNNNLETDETCRKPSIQYSEEVWELLFLKDTMEKLASARLQHHAFRHLMWYWRLCVDVQSFELENLCYYNALRKSQNIV